MPTRMTAPRGGQYTPARPAEPSLADRPAERLARRHTPAECRRMVAAFDRLGLVGPADLWFRAAGLADRHPPAGVLDDERGAAC